MRLKHLAYLVCPECKHDLRAEPTVMVEGSIETGFLRCDACGKSFEITRYVPRFVPMNNYAKGFGVEWAKHSTTQYDSYTGTPISENRIFSETQWPKNLSGQSILEVGSGSGRFTEQLAKTQAMVVSMDYSSAVDANYASNGSKSNVLIVQADIYHMPFKNEMFDKLLCIGMLQHTPRVEESFMKLIPPLKHGGSLVIDVYRKERGLKGLLMTKYWVRPITKRIKPELLYTLCKRYIELLWPLAKMLNKIPRLGIFLNWKLLIADYRGKFDLSEKMLKEWAILDTFDMLSPAFDFPQTKETVRAWFLKYGIINSDVQYTYSDIVGRGVKK